MKRIIAFLLCFVFAMMLLSACGNKSIDTVDSSTQTSQTSQTDSLSTEISNTSDDSSTQIVSEQSLPSEPISSEYLPSSSNTSTVKPPENEVIAKPSKPEDTEVVKPVGPPEVKPEDILPTSSTVEDEKEIPKVDNQEHTALNSSQYYQYNQLSADEKKIYAKLEEAVLSYNNSVDMSSLGITIKYDRAMTVMKCFKADYPQYFWISNDIKISYNPENGVASTGYLCYTDGDVTDNLADKTADRMKIARRRQAVDNAIKEIISKIGSSWSDYEKEKYIHDYIVDNMKYDQDAAQKPYNSNGCIKSAFDIYGAFINKKGVCEAYSKAFQTLCYAVGINANQAVGVGHMWNTVKLDGDWYYVDVTWDDPIVNGGTIDIISYDYFNKTTAQMNVDHSLDPNSYLKVPVCKGTKYVYNG